MTTRGWWLRFAPHTKICKRALNRLWPFLHFFSFHPISCIRTKISQERIELETNLFFHGDHRWIAENHTDGFFDCDYRNFRIHKNVCPNPIFLYLLFSSVCYNKTISLSQKSVCMILRNWIKFEIKHSGQVHLLFYF